MTATAEAARVAADIEHAEHVAPAAAVVAGHHPDRDPTTLNARERKAAAEHRFELLRQLAVTLDTHVAVHVLSVPAPDTLI